MVDEIIRRAGVDAPRDEPDAADEAVNLDPPMAFDLRTVVGSVVWCTGFGGSFSWLDPALVDALGEPRHDDIAAPYPVSGMSGCGGSAAGAPVSCRACPGMRPRSPTQCGPT